MYVFQGVPVSNPLPPLLVQVGECECFVPYRGPLCEHEETLPPKPWRAVSRRAHRQKGESSHIIEYATRFVVCLRVFT